MYPLMITNTNILPCINRCFFEKQFKLINNVSININKNSSLHINVLNNKSSIKLNGNIYNISDIIITFPGITQLNKNAYTGEILFVFYNSINETKVILSSLLSNNSNEHSSLCSSFLNEINTIVDKNSNNINDIHTSISLDINDLLPKNNTFYTYEYSDKIIWYVYKNPINIYDNCVSNLIKIIKNTTTIDTSHGFNKDIYKYIDLNSNGKNQCIINIENNINNINNTNNTNNTDKDISENTIGDLNNIKSTDILQGGTIFLIVMNILLILLFIILIIIFRNNVNAKKNIFISYSIITIIYLIIYYNITSNNIYINITNYILASLNLGFVFILYVLNNKNPTKQQISKNMYTPPKTNIQ